MCQKRCRLASKVLACAAFASAMGIASAVSAPPKFFASQKDQTFQPGELSIRRGDTVQIVNDDGELLHHAYVDSKTFTFDSGDQEPGEKVDITFTTSGAFNVLCGIHPRMKLRVHVN